MSVQDLLMTMFAGAVIGAFGQSLRMLMGLSKAKDEANQKGLDFSADVFDANRLVLSLLIGGIAGGIGILTLTNFEPLPSAKVKETFFSLLNP